MVVQCARLLASVPLSPCAETNDRQEHVFDRCFSDRAVAQWTMWCADATVESTAFLLLRKSTVRDPFSDSKNRGRVSGVNGQPRRRNCVGTATAKKTPSTVSLHGTFLAGLQFQNNVMYWNDNANVNHALRSNCISESPAATTNVPNQYMFSNSVWRCGRTTL